MPIQVPLAIFYRLDGLAINYYTRRSKFCDTQISTFPIPNSYYCFIIVSGDHGPLPILHISELQGPVLSLRDMTGPVAPTEIDSESDNESAKSDESDLDTQYFEWPEVPPSPKISIHIRRPLGKSFDRI